MGSSDALPPDPDRNLALELVRATEAAAIAASRFMGRGDKEKRRPGGRRCDAAGPPLGDDERRRRHRRGREGRGADALQRRARRQRRGPDGRRRGRPRRRDDADRQGAARRDRGASRWPSAGTMFDPGPCVYMEKLAVGRRPRRRRSTSTRRSPTTSPRSPGARASDAADVTVGDPRPPAPRRAGRARCCATGARIKFMLDGDVAGAIMAADDGLDGRRAASGPAARPRASSPRAP